jgi:hypothetical protein
MENTVVCVGFPVREPKSQFDLRGDLEWAYVDLGLRVWRSAPIVVSEHRTNFFASYSREKGENFTSMLPRRRDK